jgi:hypothetical protein
VRDHHVSASAIRAHHLSIYPFFTHPSFPHLVNRFSSQLHANSILSKPQVLLGRHDADGVGVAPAALPALDADDVVAFVEDAEADGLLDAPLETAVDVFLPHRLAEVGLLLGEEERIHTAVEVGVLRDL